MRGDGVLMVTPQSFGNADPEWVIHNVDEIVVGGQNVAVVQAEVYQASIPKKCVWALLLLSCILVLHVQQDKYADVPRWQGGGEPVSGSFPWDHQPLATANDTFEATFLFAENPAKLLDRASNFLHVPQLSPSMVIAGPNNVALAGQSFNVGAASSQNSAAAAAAGLSGVEAITSGVDLPGQGCVGGSTGSAGCFLGVQRLRVPLRPSSEKPTCHRFLGGVSPARMRQLHDSQSNSSAFCIRAKQVNSVVPGGPGSAVITWDNLRSGREGSDGSTCVAVVGLAPELRVTQVFRAEWVSTVLWDNSSSSFVTVGFAAKTVVVVQYDAVLFQPVRRYRLPLSVAWLLRAPRLADGFLLFVGSEEPFAGTTFTVDLKNSEVYEQEPPIPGGGRQKPLRRRLPRVVDSIPLRPTEGGIPVGNFAGHKGVGKEGSWGVCELRTCLADALEGCL